MLRKLLLGAIAAVSFLGIANAADMPRAPAYYKAPPVAVFNWTGFYVGGTVGYGWGSNRHLNTTTGIGSQDFDVDGFVAGATLGYNWQGPGSNWVWGLELDVSYADVNGVLPVAPGFGCVGGCTTDLKWFGTFRGRLGYAFDRSMIYATGGLAFGEVEGSIIGLTGRGSETVLGWTAGAGIEFAIAPRWSMKAEYLYVSMDQAQYAVVAGNNIVVDDLNFHVVRLGVNYRW
ncbi:MAG TPA: porin family protein [Xanthobacteraceae bacterium]|nr:porin family protein [Xanthobacteraceae bacterium]